MKWVYKGKPLKKYLKNVVGNIDDLDYVYSFIVNILRKEYKSEIDLNFLIEDVMNRDKVKKKINGQIKRTIRKSWNYKGQPLKEYLKAIIKNKDNLKYLYETMRRILEKEYKENTNLDELIEDIIKSEKINKIINDEYVKQQKQIWTYKNKPLKEYLYEIISNKEDLQFLYQTIGNILRSEYKDNKNLDELIEDILNRENIKHIISENYMRKEQIKWYYKELSLEEYIELNIKSKYRNSLQIRKNIENYVTKKIDQNNLYISKREELIDEYINSSKFKNFLNTPPKDKLEYFYKGERLRKFLRKSVKDKDKLDYIYSFIIFKISTMYKLESNIDDVINKVMSSEEIIKLIKSDNIIKLEKEIWPYKEGLLIDYLKTIDLNGKDLNNVYNQVREFLGRRYPEGFNSIEEKSKVIEGYITSEEFSKYLKYGYVSKKYYYKGMLLIDYLKLNYENLLDKKDKSIDNLYDKVLRMLSNYGDVDSLSIEEIELLIEKILNSDEFKTYLNNEKISYYSWNYNGNTLKDVICKYYSKIIEDEIDLNRIYLTITSSARKVKLKNLDIDNNTILSRYFTKEFIEEFEENYLRRKEIRKELSKKNELYSNIDDFEYIKKYLKDNNLNLNDINKICNHGFNYYNAIMILEYAIKYSMSIDDLISYTLNTNMKDDNYSLWLFKLGFKEYVNNVVENNKKLINHFIYMYTLQIFGKQICINYDEIYSYLMELLLTRHIVFTVERQYLYNSFKKFCESCIKRYLYDLRRKLSIEKNDSIDDEEFFVQIPSNVNLEEEYINLEDKSLLYNAIDSLSEIEKEFINLRYGFTTKQHNLIEISNIFSLKGIDLDMSDLEALDKSVLDKLRENPKILNLRINN